MTRRHFNLMLVFAIVAGLVLFVWLSIVSTAKTSSSASITQPPHSQISVAETAPDRTESRTHVMRPDALQQLIQQQCQQLGEAVTIEHCQTQALQDFQAGKLDPVIPTWDPNACNDITDSLQQHRCHAELGRDYAVSTGDLTHCAIIPLPDIQADCRTAIIINQIKTLYSLEQQPDQMSPGEPRI